MRVLVATDLSEPGLLAIETLLGCNPELFEKVTLLHVVDAEHYMADIPVGDVVELAESRLKQEHTALTEAGFDADHRIARGHAAEVVQQVAQEVRANLVVVTDRGRSGAPGRLLGSTAERIALAGKVPVYVERVEEREATWCRLAEGPPFTRAYIVAEMDESLRRMANEVAALPTVEAVRVAYVASRAEGSDDERRFIEEQLAESSLEDAEIVVLQGGDPAEALMKDAELFGATLMVLGPRRHGVVKRVVFGTVALSLLRESNLPVMFA